jgi:hypothetical protein
VRAIVKAREDREYVKITAIDHLGKIGHMGLQFGGHVGVIDIGPVKEER